MHPQLLYNPGRSTFMCIFTGWRCKLKKKTIIGSVVTVIVVAAFIVGVVAFGPDSEVEELEGVEVTEYKGENLSSINDFRENSIKGPQDVENESYRLLLTGLIEDPQEFTYNQVVSNYPLYEKVVTLHCVEGWEVTILWEGVLVDDLLQAAKVTGDTKIVIFYAVDGYSTSLPYDYVVENNILLAYKMNGVVLPPDRGFPFQLVAESKWGYKWIKWVTHIEVSADETFRGYWESRGFSNDADVP